jgi:hypothetical protein
MEKIKLGTYVRSEQQSIEGIVTDIQPCGSPTCNDTNLTIKTPDGDEQFYYHAYSFIDTYYNDLKVIQRVWKTLPVEVIGGFFTWEILEVVGEPFNTGYLTKCRDGSWIVIQCYHTFTEERADSIVNDYTDKYQKVIIVDAKKEEN